MVKRFFYLAVGALALTACTSEDVLDDVKTSSRNLIRFENVVNKPSRAANDITTTNLTQFNVFGFYTLSDAPTHAYEVFKNVPVINPGSGIWNYDDQYARYWVPGATYYFYAYSCGSSALNESYGTFDLDVDNKDGGKNVANRLFTINNYLCNDSHQHDLLYASNTGTKGNDITQTGVNANEVVSFQFQHILSKIQARFTTTLPSEYEVEVSEVSVRNICDLGNFDSANGWTTVVRKEGAPFVLLLEHAQGETPAQTLKITNKKVNDSNGKEIQDYRETNYAYVIPNTYSDKEVNFKFTVTIRVGGDQALKRELSASFQPDWKKGYSYLYTINIDDKALKLGKITFTTTANVDGWGDGSNTDVSVD